MSMVAVVEAVYDELAGMGLRQEHEGFDDLMIICSNVAAGRARSVDEVVGTFKIIPDKAVMSTWDIVSYVRECGVNLSATEVLAKAIAAGKRAAGRKEDSCELNTYCSGKLI